MKRIASVSGGVAQRFSIAADVIGMLGGGFLVGKKGVGGNGDKGFEGVVGIVSTGIEEADIVVNGVGDVGHVGIALSDFGVRGGVERGDCGKDGLHILAHTRDGEFGRVGKGGAKFGGRGVHVNQYGLHDVQKDGEKELVVGEFINPLGVFEYGGGDLLTVLFHCLLVDC